MSTLKNRILAIDFETANRYPQSVCAIGAWLYEEGEIKEVLNTLIKPPEEYGHFEYWNVKIHGITKRDVKDAVTFPMIHKQLQPYLESSYVCGHHISFDLGCYQKAAEYYGILCPSIHYFDTITVSKRMIPDLQHYRLNTVCSQLQIPLNHHQASSDAYASLMIALHALELSQQESIEKMLQMLHVNTLHR